MAPITTYSLAFPLFAAYTTTYNNSQEATKWKQVEQFLENIYPTDKLEERNSLSRKDGYWKYVNRNEKAPLEYTYGEFDIQFFSSILQIAARYHKNDEGKFNEYSLNDIVFTDLGSGTGRLVLAAAALHPELKLSKGIELLDGLHNYASDVINKFLLEREDGCLLASMFDELDGFDEQLVEEKTNELYKFDASTIGSTAEYKFDFTDLIEKLGLDPADGDKEECEVEDTDLDLLEEEDELCLISYEDGEDFNLCEQEDQTEKETALPQINKAEDLSSHRNVFSAPASAFEEIVNTGHILSECVDLAPIELTCASFTDPYEYFGDSDIVFVFSSCMNKSVLEQLGGAIGRQCKEGTIVVTTDYTLPLYGIVEPVKDDVRIPHGEYELELLESIDGECRVTNGSTAHFHRVKKSLHTGLKVARPTYTEQEKAYKIVEKLESGSLADTEKFLREVSNLMVFHGIDPKLRPKLDNEENNCS